MLLPIVVYPGHLQHDLSGALHRGELPATRIRFWRGHRRPSGLEFLGQNLKQNTLQLQYDFSKRLSGRVGYRYTNRKIAQFNSSFNSAEIYFPGGSAGTATNDHLAARGDCAFPAAPAPHVLPSNLRPSVQRIDHRDRPGSGSETARIVDDINEQAALLGFTARPMDSLRITGDFEFGYNDSPTPAPAPGRCKATRSMPTTRRGQWLNFDGSIDIHENRDNVYQVNNLEHGRTYGFVTVISPKAKYSLDRRLQLHQYLLAGPCLLRRERHRSAHLSGLPHRRIARGAERHVLLYNSNQHFAYFDVMWKPIQRVSTTLGYSGTFVGGSTLFLNPLQPAGDSSHSITQSPTQR